MSRFSLDPVGQLARAGQRIRAADDCRLASALGTAIICSDARLIGVGTAWHLHGAPTEGAFVTLAHKGWIGVPRADAVLGRGRALRQLREPGRCQPSSACRLICLNGPGFGIVHYLTFKEPVSKGRQ